MEVITRWLERAEALIYVMAGVLLGLAALVILGHTLVVFVAHVLDGEILKGIIELLEQLLLALMSVELLYTVMVSLRTRSLSAEPFLIVGLVAAVRRVLTISVEAAHFFTTDLEKFRLALYEIGLLAVTILILVVSIYVLRKAGRPRDGAAPSPGAAVASPEPRGA